MKKQNLLTIWAKRAVPALALAAMVLPACKKEPDQIQQHDEEILYYTNNNENPKWKRDTINKYASDKSVRCIYIVPAESFIYFNSDNISASRRELQKVMDISSKCRGRGNFEFTSGVCTYGDSLDLVAMGFTVNQHNQ